MPVKCSAFKYFDVFFNVQLLTVDESNICYYRLCTKARAEEKCD